MHSKLAQARTLLENTTPLKGDCGAYCAAACCHADEEGRGGMLLFPGEIAFYTPSPAWARIVPSDFFVDGEPLPMLTCQGECPRGDRPLACRIFPLTPVLRNGELHVEMDVRAWPVCPLMDSGTAGLRGDFVIAVREALSLLLDDPACRAYFAQLTEHLAAFRSF